MYVPAKQQTILMKIILKTFKVSGNCHKNIQQMEKVFQENLLILIKNSENFWHSSHNLPPPNSPSPQKMQKEGNNKDYSKN